MATIPLMAGDLESGLGKAPPYEEVVNKGSPNRKSSPEKALTSGVLFLLFNGYRMISVNNRRRGFFFDAADDFISGSSVAAAHMQIRMGFIRKVLGILSIQLVATFVVSAIAVFTPGVKGFVQQQGWLLGIAFVGSLVLLVTMLIYRHESPTNYWILPAWTFVEAYTVGVITTFYDVDLVVEAVFLTAAVVVALFFYTLQSTRDFSSMGAGLFSVLWVLFIAGILQMFLMSPAMELFLAAGGACLFSLFIVFDLHMLMHKLSPEEYILATINLYLDIINLFLNILRLLQATRKE